MQTWVAGDDNGEFSQHLSRYLVADVQPGYPDGPGKHLVVLGGPIPDEVLLACASAVLVEPGLDERDRVMRMLAGQTRPRLDFVEHVAASIHAERTWALILTLAMRVPQATAAVAASPVDRSDLVTSAPHGSWLNVEAPVSLFGGTLGLVGYTPMGWRLADLAKQFGMRTIYWLEATASSDRVDIEGAALSTGSVEARSDELLATADVVVLDVEYSIDSVRLIDAPELALMRADALLVNTAHGRAIDEGALIQALRASRLGGVALDRFNYEPLLDDSPLRSIERVLLTPGIAFPERTAVSERTAAEVARLLGARSASSLPTRRVRHVQRRRSAG